jgi:leader peptidase (prepilin peptidase)/N-methyltransferase
MITLMLVFYGICLGSFINALVWRLRFKRLHAGLDKEEDEQTDDEDGQMSLGRYGVYIVTSIYEEIRDWLLAPYRFVRAWSRSRGSSEDKYSIATGRSMCPHCEHELAAKDLIPIVSWLWLRGRCRYCKKPISGQYPLVEALTGVVFLVSYLRWSYGFSALGYVLLAVWLLIVTGMIALAVYDFKYRFLPNELLYPLLWLAVVFVGLLWALEGTQAALVAGAGMFTIWGLFFLIFAAGELAGRRWIGYGDVRLAVLIGVVVGGPLNALLVVFFASILGLFGSSPAIAKGAVDARTRLPFGPFLVAATFLVVWFGDSIASWYLGLLTG